MRKEKGINRQSTENVYYSETTSYEIIMMVYVIIHLNKPTECTTRVSPKVNSGFGVITMCQCRFTLGNKCDILVSNVENSGGYACVGLRNICEFSVPSSQFCCEPKTDLKKVIKKSLN